MDPKPFPSKEEKQKETNTYKKGYWCLTGTGKGEVIKKNVEKSLLQKRAVFMLIDCFDASQAVEFLQRLVQDLLHPQVLLLGFW